MARFKVATFAVVLALSACARFATADDQTVLGPVRFAATSNPKAEPGYLDPFHPRYLAGGVQKAKDGTWVAVGFDATYPNDRGFVKKFGLDGGALRNFHIGYPPLRGGDVVPAFGRLYRVTPVAHGLGGRTQTADFEWVGERPKGLEIALTPEAFQIPVSTGGVRCFANVSMNKVQIVKITPPDEKVKQPIARVRVDLWSGAESQSTDATVGNILMLGDRGHRVLAIVPPDPKTRVIGWVEFDPEPLSEATIKSKGLSDQVVRPAAK